MSCETGSSIHRVELDIHSAQVTISDPVAPAFDGVPAGTPVDGAWVRGTPTVSARGGDHLGVQRFDVVIGGEVVGADDRSVAHCDYRRLRPCVPATGQATPGLHVVDSAPIALDTRLVPDGTHVGAVRVVDAAGNTATSSPFTVRVDNTAPGVGATSAAGGAGWSRTATRTIAVSPDGATERAPLTAAHVRLCRVTDPTTCTGTVRHAGDRGAVPVTVPGDGAWSIHARLEDAAGNVGPEATDESAAVRLDTTPPRATLATPAAITDADPLTPTMDADDAGSGVDVATTRYTATESATGVRREFAPGDRLPVGTWTIVATVTDRAGNTTQTSSTTAVAPAPVPAVPAPADPIPVPAPTAASTPTPTPSALAAVRATMTTRWTRRPATRRRPAARVLEVRATLRGLPSRGTVRVTFQPRGRTTRVALRTRRRGARVTSTLVRRRRAAGVVRITLRLDGRTRTLRRDVR